MSSSHRGEDTFRGKWCQLDKDSRDRRNSINVFNSLSDVIHCWVCLCDVCLCLLQSGSVQWEKHLSSCELELKFQLCGFISLLLSMTVHVNMRNQRSMERNRNTWCFYTAWKCYWKEEAGYKAACRESSRPLPFKGFSSGSLQLKSSHV